MTDKALVPIQQRQVIFYEDEITAVLIEAAERQEIYVPIRQISDYLGLAFAAQRTRINRDPVLSDAVRIINIATESEKGGNPNVLCIPLKYMPGWLFGISVTRVKPELQDKILRYQRECYDVLWDAFQEGRLATTGDVTFDELLQRSDSEAVEAYKMLQAMVKLARNQILIEARLEYHDSRLADYETRLEAVETVLGDPGRSVTPDQAMQISQAVKMVAMELGKRTKKNEYGSVYGQLYRQFAVTSYKQLPSSQFEQAMSWLTDWYKRITGATGPDEVPF